MDPPGPQAGLQVGLDHATRRSRQHPPGLRAVDLGSKLQVHPCTPPNERSRVVEFTIFRISGSSVADLRGVLLSEAG
jgi:hypothetical protein